MFHSLSFEFLFDLLVYKKNKVCCSIIRKTQRTYPWISKICLCEHLPHTDSSAKCMQLVDAFVSCCVVVIKGTGFPRVSLGFCVSSCLIGLSFSGCDLCVFFHLLRLWCLQGLGWNTFCESHRAQVIYTFFLMYVVALQETVLLLYVFSFLFRFLEGDYISAVWNDARSSGFCSVWTQCARDWEVVHSNNINKDEERNKNIFFFTKKIAPEFNDFCVLVNFAFRNFNVLLIY